MRELRIINEPEKVAEEPVYLKLEWRTGGGGKNIISVVACDKEGKRLVCGKLVSFYPGEGVYLHAGVNQCVPLPRNEEDGKLKEALQ